MAKEVIHVYDGEHKHIPQPAAPEPPVHPDAENFWSHQEEMWQKAKEEEARLKVNRDLLNGRVALTLDGEKLVTEEEARKITGPYMLLDKTPEELQAYLTAKKATTHTFLAKPQPAKIDWQYLPWDALEEVALATQIGAEKHPGADDYLEGSHTYKDLSSGLLRHYAAWAQGDDIDQDGFHHLAGVAARCLMLIALHKRGRGDLDDR